MAKVPPFEMPLEEIREELDRIRHPFRIAIRRSKNPFNVGAIIRTAHSFLAKEILLIGEEDWYRRAAMGMQRYERITEIPTERAFLERAEAEGWPLLALEREEASAGLWEAEIPADAVFIVGNEEEGVGETLLSAAHQVVGIPMFGINHSYPMTVAAGIVMAEWARRHYAGKRRVILTPTGDG